ncbi:aldose 1-epimerase [Curvibacter sp. CHRR-16]|uniref:aldose 1-epimerase n=1 Tax=Curvibacter sp. CHRR-16 TaxID=2835872 RepID=UPI001BDAEB8F|nr:aldose 1-epimerase [Curvibacter sp. CHRR-16]MBT0570100.1 aldose 1-epimerase [Curvibacter sp. CHRR-16]
MTAPMTDPLSELVLQQADVRMALLPALGGTIRSLRWGNEPLLRLPDDQPLQHGREAGSYPLVPFSNRIGYAQAQWDGQPLDIEINFPGDKHMAHGIGWQRPWQVHSSSASEALLQLHHDPSQPSPSPIPGKWPFAFTAMQYFKLHAHALDMEMTITNDHSGPAPVGLGWHPFFEKRHGMRVQFACEGRWEMNEDKLPTHFSPVAGMVADLATLDVDHCYDGWHGDVLLEDERIRLRMHSNLRRLVVFTNPQRNNIAIEPVSHVNNAINLAEEQGVSIESLGLVVLQPGERYSAHMRLEWTLK